MVNNSTSMHNVANKSNTMNGPRPQSASSAPLEARLRRSCSVLSS